MIWGVLAIVVVIAAYLFASRKDAKDAARGQIAEADLAKAQDANKPATPDERANVVKLYQRN